MKFDVQIVDYPKSQETAKKVQVGTWFLFAEGVQQSGGRLSRLLAKAPKSRSVHALVGAPFDLEGVRFTPHDRGVGALAALVCDRDLYRAEQDTANLFVAAPSALPALTLALEMNGAPLTECAVAIGPNGVAIEPFAALLAGRYVARLLSDGLPVGREAEFTVAEYTLAPLTGRLLAHRLDRAADSIHFEIEAESYQVPYERDLQIALVEGGREVSRATVRPSRPGHYAGSLKVGGGEGALRFRLTADGGRIAEVAIPGSRRRERESIVVSELGREVSLSLMPEAGALPVRGTYLTQGDFLATPLVVENVAGVQGVLRAQSEIESLTLVTIDLATGKPSVVEKGNVKAGDEIVLRPNPAMTVFAGGFVGGRPFEGFTTFIRPSQLALTLDAPPRARPREDLAIRVSVSGSARVPVLVSVRDQRLTSADTPEASLAAGMQRAIRSATEGMKDAAFTPLVTHIPRPAPASMRRATGGFWRGSAGPVPAARPASALDRTRSGSFEGAADDVDDVLSDNEPVGAALDQSVDLSAEFDAGLDEEVTGSFGAAKTVTVGRKADATPTEPPRSEFPEVLFYGIVDVMGTETIRVPLADSLGTFSIEAFAIAEGDWTRADSTVVVDRPVRADLEVPPAVHENDRVRGELRVATSSGRALVSLMRDGVQIVAPTEIATPGVVPFDVKPGLHVATVEDAQSGEKDVIEVHVGVPGKFRSVVREIALLQKGETMSLDSADALSLRILPGIEGPMETLCEATAGYEHLCCEQTAAKVLAAAAMWLTAKQAARRKKAESILLAGIAREKRMWMRGQGFAMYPGREVSEYYSPKVVRYLWTLAPIASAPGASNALKGAVADALAMADDVSRPFKIAKTPDRIGSPEDAWQIAARVPSRRKQVTDWIASAVDSSGKEPKPRAINGAVDARATLAFAGAALVACGELAGALKMANVVLHDMNEKGRLYSTVDSVAAIALFGELASAGVLRGNGRVRVNGREVTAVDAAASSDQVETVDVLDGVIAVEITRIHEEDWTRFSSDLPVRIGFRDESGKTPSKFIAGDRLDLRVELPKGYQDGDLVHIALPASLAWIEGGGSVKRFSRDFEGRNELVVPLVVTGAVDGKQHFAVCVRNMFEEERAVSPGVLSIGG